MAEKTKIEWCDHTFNPWTGCTKVSAGCANCYAESLARRAPKTFGGWGKGVPRKRTSEANWRLPLKWNREAAESVEDALHDFGEERYVAPPRPRVFCASMADWLDPEVPVEWLADLLDLIRQTPHLDWLLMTKRPELWRERISSIKTESTELAAWLLSWLLSGGQFVGGRFDGLTPVGPANIWVGTTVENQEAADGRIPALLDIPAAVRFLSCEPLLGELNLLRHCNREVATDERGFPSWKHVGCVDWVICGGESGPGARPMHPDWARSLRDQCKAAGVPFFFKQWGEWAPFVNEAYFTNGGEEKQPHCWVDGRTGKNGECWVRGGDLGWSNWNGDHECDQDGTVHSSVAVMGKHGKKRAGRLLDGVEHNEFPEVRRG